MRTPQLILGLDIEVHPGAHVRQPRASTVGAGGDRCELVQQGADEEGSMSRVMHVAMSSDRIYKSLLFRSQGLNFRTGRMIEINQCGTKDYMGIAENGCDALDVLFSYVDMHLMPPCRAIFELTYIVANFTKHSNRFSSSVRRVVLQRLKKGKGVPIEHFDCFLPTSRQKQRKLFPFNDVHLSKGKKSVNAAGVFCDLYELGNASGGHKSRPFLSIMLQRVLCTHSNPNCYKTSDCGSQTRKNIPVHERQASCFDKELIWSHRKAWA